ncbi:ZPR1 zinc finger domain-containing protein [Candidatus Woesearchaeota archaeon]|nr:ZPR1 zinc finger domain-containing protein [Candidatus Woesearchaeota archaeon]
MKRSSGKEKSSAEKSKIAAEAPEELDHEPCPLCHQKTLVLSESESEIPFFGKVFLYSMTCTACKYHKADVEAAEQHEPARYTFEISSEDDMKVRVVKSSEATVKIPHITTITPGPAAQGYVTNIEGILNRVKAQIETLRDTAEDDEDKTKAKNLLKKLIRIKWGQEKQKLIIEDPTGNSAIISDKAQKSKL